MDFLFVLMAANWSYIVSPENLFDCFRREFEIVMANQFGLDASGSEISLLAELQKQLFVRCGNFRQRSFMRATTHFLQSVFAVCLIASPPFAKRWTGDTAAAADQPEIISLFVELNPR